jgi:hypothetical protein
VKLLYDLDSDRLRKPCGLIEARVGIAARGAAEIGKGDDRAGAARELRVAAVEAGAQEPCSSSWLSTKLTGLSGCTVEIACL